MRVTAAKNEAVAASENATTKAGEAFTSAENAKQSEINAEEAEEAALLVIGTEGNNQVSRVKTEGDTQVSRVEAVLEDIVVVGKTAPGFGIWLEEV